MATTLPHLSYTPPPWAGAAPEASFSSPPRCWLRSLRLPQAPAPSSV